MPENSPTIQIGGRVMYLLVAVLILLVWALYGITKSMQLANPPIEDIEKHLKYIQSLPNQKARKKYLNKLK